MNIIKQENGEVVITLENRKEVLGMFVRFYADPETIAFELKEMQRCGCPEWYPDKELQQVIDIYEKEKFGKDEDRAMVYTELAKILGVDI